MKIRKLTPKQQGYPGVLTTIASVPKQLYYLGTPPDDLLGLPAIAVVGSRKVSSYGQRATEELATALANRGLTIISGLAIGVDTIALRAAVAVGGKTIAVLPCGLDEIYPRGNQLLAKRILETGGTLLTEYSERTIPFEQNFIARNRIVSGLAQALLITEAAEKSGSLHTAKFALEQGREVCAVPGSIYSVTSVGCNNLIKNGATPVTSVDDVLNVLGVANKPTIKREIIAANEPEHILMTLMNEGVTDTEDLLKQSHLDPSLFNQTLTMLEISGKAKPTTGQWYLL